MKLILAALFAAFAVCAVLVFLFQIQYGRLNGPNSESAKLGTESPAAKRCRHRAVCAAVAAAIFQIGRAHV